MNSFQESKNELEAAIRYAENAISSAQGTIESMEFRQEMAKKNYQEQTGREEALAKQVQELESKVQGQYDDIVMLEREVEVYTKKYNELATGHESETIEHLQDQNLELKEKVQELLADITMLQQQRAVRKEEREMLDKNIHYLRDENERLSREVEKLRSEKEASSGPCGCQAYRDIEEAQGRAEGEVELLQRTIADLEAQVNALEQPERPTMPVIPKAVAIAIFREGVACGVSSACDEIDNTNDIEINETGYTGGFEVSFTEYIDLSEHLDLDWMRDKVGDYDEASVIEALKTLCADNKFECRIHGIDDQEQKNAN